MPLYSRVRNFYKEQITSLVRYCSHLDNRKTAFAIASAICIGITHLFGFTFLLATSFGLVFRLNQVIMQSVHLLVSPLQIVLFYPFIRAGRSVFGLENNLTITVKQIPAYIMNHTRDFMSEYSKIYMAGIAIWIIFSLIAGFIIYRIIWMYFDRHKESKKTIKRASEEIDLGSIKI